MHIVVVCYLFLSAVADTVLFYFTEETELEIKLKLDESEPNIPLKPEYSLASVKANRAQTETYVQRA